MNTKLLLHLFTLMFYFNERALKNAIIALLAGEQMPRVLMTVIR